MARSGGTAGMLVVAAAVLGLSWWGLRRMTETQKELLGKLDAAVSEGGTGATTSTQLVLPIPSHMLGGKAPVMRLDIVVRVDGLDVTVDGAPACRDGHKRLIGRGSSDAPGSFDEGALIGCINGLRGDGGDALGLLQAFLPLR